MSTQHVKNFQVIERLDAGGMAEVYRGRQISMEGFEKQVALKRILPNFAKNERFIRMFLDEAKLSLRLNHANIVSVFDVSQTADTYFIVMEYVDGLNLKKLVDAARQREGAVPVEFACYIAARVCDALQYAHDRRDDSGQPLNIVHRDVSPPNVLISWDGEVKLTDFGLAKAASQVELTDPGVVKGKFGYLSPEAALGEPVDSRTDIFATGIVLWEMLAGRRLFLGNTDVETLQAVRAAEVPSLREANGRVSPALEQIIRRALARNREDRYANARELGSALAQHLVASGHSVTAWDLASWVREIASLAPSPKAGSGSSVSTNLIQEEINRLVREQAARGSSTSGSRSFEDPRQWTGFDDDEGAGSAPPTAHYASHKPGISEKMAATPRVRTQAMRAVAAPSPTPSPVAVQHTPAPVSAPGSTPAAAPVETLAADSSAASSLSPASSPSVSWKNRIIPLAMIALIVVLLAVLFVLVSSGGA